MPTLAQALTSHWTVADLFRRFGPVPVCRVRFSPPPGTATEGDVIRIHETEGILCELSEETLLEKSMGTWESCIAMTLGAVLHEFVRKHDLGLILGPDGMIRLSQGLIRIPDVSFISWDRLPGRCIPDEAVSSIVPDLAVEIISRGNTGEEMSQKLDDYLTAGVRLIWYIDPRAQEARIYRGAGEFERCTRDQYLDGGDVIPGFSMCLADLLRNPPSAGSAAGSD